MKNYLKFTISLISLLVLLQNDLYPNSNLIGLGITSGYFSAKNDVKYLYSCEGCKTLNDFSSGNVFFGFTSELNLIYPKYISLMANLYYSKMKFLKTEPDSKFPSLVDDGSGGFKTIVTETRWDWEGEISQLNIDLMLKFKIPQFDLGISAGINLGYNLDTKYTENLRFISEQGIFIDNENFRKNGYQIIEKGRVLKLFGGQLPYKNDLRLALKAGLNYDYHILNYSISPFIYYDFPLTSVVYDINRECGSICPTYYVLTKNWHWKITNISAGIDFKYWL